MVDVKSDPRAWSSASWFPKLGGVTLGEYKTGVRAVREVVNELNQPGHTPLLVGVKQQGGNQQPLSGPGFTAVPPISEQLATPDQALSEQWTAYGRQLADAGIKLNLTPDVTAMGDKSPAVISGLQSAGVGTAATSVIGQDTTSTAAAALVIEQADAVVIPTSAVAFLDADNPGVFSATTMSMVREAMAFNGLLVSDDLASLTAVPTGQRAVKFVTAGGELIYTSDASSVEPMIASLTSNSDPELAGKVTQAATNVLAIKAKLGLVTCQNARG